MSPEPKFTSDISKEIARDEEFIKSILLEMKTNKLVISVNKNPQGIEYTKRQRWRLSNEAYAVYLKQQNLSQLPKPMQSNFSFFSDT